MTTFLRALKLLSVACALLFGLTALVRPAAEQTGTAALALPADEPPARPDARPTPDALRQDGERAAGDEDPVDVLDRVVRARFHNHIGFGMARIATERRFRPETEEERAAVRAISRAGLRVGLFLVGRRVLSDATPAQLQAVMAVHMSWPGRTVSGPIFLSGTDAKRLPGASAMREGARRAMLSFAAGGESYDFEAEGWKAAARPVRAAESCLQCHAADVEMRPVVVGDKTFYEMRPSDQRLKVGDPLGAVLYVYQRRD